MTCGGLTERALIRRSVPLLVRTAQDAKARGKVAVAALVGRTARALSEFAAQTAEPKTNDERAWFGPRTKMAVEVAVGAWLADGKAAKRLPAAGAMEEENPYVFGVAAWQLALLAETLRREVLRCRTQDRPQAKRRLGPIAREIDRLARSLQRRAGRLS